MQKIKFVICGAQGRVGEVLCHSILTTPSYVLAGAVVKNVNDKVEKFREKLKSSSVTVANDLIISDNIADTLKKAQADVIIDFSHHTVLDELLKNAVALQIPVVIGTTGYTLEQLAQIKKTAEEIPIFLASNFSLGVTVLNRVSREVAQILGFEDFNAEIVEAHHNQKADAPSGTALTLAKNVCDGFQLNMEKDVIYGRCGLIGKRPPNEVAVHALRMGSIIGDHTVYFASKFERIELSHKAMNRDVFAFGAIKAAVWLVSQTPGLYDMENMLFRGI